MPICLITGGAGFIGSHLARVLLDRGSSVRVLDNLSTGSLANLPSFAQALQVYQGDSTDLNLVRRATQGADLVFHLASPAEAGEMLGTADGAQAELMAAHCVLQAAWESRVRRVVYASSLRVYGTIQGERCAEGRPLLPRCLAGSAKILGEQTCMEWTRRQGLETVRLRYFNVFGPRQPPQSPYAAPVRLALDAALADQPAAIDADAYTIQDLVSIGDAVHAAILAAETPRVSGKVYNVGLGKPTSLKDVSAALASILGVPLRLNQSNCSAGNDLGNLADPSRAEVELGFCAGMHLERDLRPCLAARSEALGNSFRNRYRTQSNNFP
jgi:UDP-glucose 4-epimerase